MFLTNSLKATALLAAMSLAGCVTPTDTPSTSAATAVQEPAVATVSPSTESDPIVSASFRSGGGNWDGLGSILFRYTAIERNGEIYICGAYTARGSTDIRRLSREVMRQAAVSANGETISRNMRFFREASNAAYSTRLVGVETNCRTTGRAAGAFPLESVTVGTRSGNYRIRR